MGSVSSQIVIVYTKDNGNVFDTWSLIASCTVRRPYEVGWLPYLTSKHKNCIVYCCTCFFEECYKKKQWSVYLHKNVAN